MIPITLVQTVSDDPTCRATSRLETSSRIMMQRLLKNARAYGNNRAARPTIPETLLTNRQAKVSETTIRAPSRPIVTKEGFTISDRDPVPQPATTEAVEGRPVASFSFHTKQCVQLASSRTRVWSLLAKSTEKRNSCPDRPSKLKEPRVSR